MWKYVTRRIRDTFERSANHFDRRSTTVVNSAPGSFNDEKKKQPCCNWFVSRNCWNSSQNDNGTNSKKWSFEHLNKSWMDAITWSGALVLGWYTSQLIHLKLRHHLRANKRNCLTVNDLLSSVQPYITCGNKDNFYLNSSPKIREVVSNFTPTVHLVSNDQNGSGKEKSSNSGSSTSQDSSDDDLGEVLNSIENRLGLAAIENGQYQDGLSLLRAHATPALIQILPPRYHAAEQPAAPRSSSYLTRTSSSRGRGHAPYDRVLDTVILHQVHRSAANRNHAPALYNLGLCYENGLGVSANEKMAMELYKSAAVLKHPGALYNLGVFYGQGRGGLKSDQETATRLLRLAAVQGQQDAIDALKALDVTITEPPNNDVNTWIYQHSPFPQNDNMVPTHTRLFVENLNYLQAQQCEATF